VDAVKQQLGVELRGLRERAAMSGSMVAAQLGWSQSKVSRVETARFGATLTEVAELVSVFDVPDDVRAELLSMAARASGVPGAWVVRAGGAPRRQSEVASVESRLAGLRQYHALVVPGLLQAPAYTRAIALAGGFGDPDDLVERRRRRQAQVGNAGGPDCRFVIDERALLRWPGDRTVMVDQLDHLAAAAKRPTMDVRILRVGAGATVLSVAPFIIYDYLSTDSPPVVFCESQTADTYLSDLSDVETHSALFERLHREALSPTASRKFLSEMRRTLAT
jgi:hypothetical protein